MNILLYLELLDFVLIRFVTTTNHVDMDMLPSDWPLFVSRHCGRLCQDGMLVTTPSICSYPPCFPCDCGEMCSIKGTCCPTNDSNTEAVSYELSKTSPNSYSNDIYKTVVCRLPPFSYPTKETLYLTVVKCPVTWKDKDVQQKCEHPDGDSFDSVTPYTDLNSGLVFGNMFCLMCHGLVPKNTESNDTDTVQPDRLSNTSQIQAWDMEIYCRNYQNLFHIVDRFEFYKRALADKSMCDVTFTETGNVTKCPKKFDNTPTTISPCSVNSHDTLKELCHNVTDMQALRVPSAKNIFCSMCQGVELERYPCVSNDRFFDETLSLSAYPPVVLLFIASERKDEYKGKTSNCLSSQWQNEKGQCISATCPSGKVVESGASCRSALGNIGRVNYVLNMTLVIQETVPVEWFESIANAMEQRLRQLGGRFRLQYQVKRCTSGDHFTTDQQEIDVSGSITGSKSMPRDRFEEEMFEILSKNEWHLDISNDENVPQVVTLRTVCLGEGLCEFYRNTSDGHTCPQSPHVDNDGWQPFPGHIEITQSLTCPSLTLNLTAEPVIVDKNMIFTIELNNQPIAVTWNSNIFMVDNEVRVCLSFLKELTRQLEESTSQYIAFSFHNLGSALLTISYFLDIVCIATSCICLMASIFTYLLFPSLLSLPGLNNLSLCLSLLTAQASLLVTSLLGSRSLLTQIHCLIHAVILHYSWIASFVWMNTCCIHMYRIFTGPKLGSYKRQFLMYCIYSFGFPFFVVVALMAVTTVTTSGKSIGYKSDVCFLDTTTSSLILILGLLTPLGLTVIINGVLFILTVKQILWVTKMQLQRRSTHGVFTYLKLSTVTGAFCLFSAASVQFESPIMFLISSPFAALQGVFIFTSFIVNKRVLKMYKGLILHRVKSDALCNNTTHTNNSIMDSGFELHPTESRPNEQYDNGY